MSKNREILSIFETADDALHGLLGYYIFTQLAVKCAPDNALRATLPPGSIKITLDWVRYYTEEELLNTMRQIYSPVHARICIVNIAGIFDAAISRIIRHLNHTKKLKSISYRSKYKNKLIWAFKFVEKSNFEPNKKLIRIPDFCFYVDHVRKIRNVLLHNHGIIDENYNTDFIPQDRIPSSFIDQFEKLEKKNRIDDIYIPNPNSFMHFAQCHIGLLHVFHNEIQSYYFGHKSGYNYTEEHKTIEWHKLLLGAYAP